MFYWICHRYSIVNRERQQLTMKSRAQLVKAIPSVKDANFEALALAIFQYQYAKNPIYQKYCDLLNIQPKSVAKFTQIPFLPIQFFKNHTIKSGNWEEETIFRSSGTTGSTTSQHYIRDIAFYQQITKRGFEFYYGDLNDICILALLPSYLERNDSSLVAMTDYLIRESKHPQSGFFLDDMQALVARLKDCQAKGIRTLLLGVSFALLDLAEQYPMDLSELIIMETGGMKGRRKELTRKELHDALKTAFNVKKIHSEYGMTELLSQGYQIGYQQDMYFPTGTMRVFTRDITDPLKLIRNGRMGAINVMDLANIDTCSFIATEDIGKAHRDYTFSILGRLDASDLRGCNLLVF